MAIKVKRVADSPIKIVKDVTPSQVIELNPITGEFVRKAYSPYIDETTGTWFTYNENLKIFEDTHVVAKGEKGDKGDRGIQGVKGVDGKDGKDGIDGKNGTNGINGKDGVDGYTPRKGIDYFDGRNGIDGKNGTNGKDGYTPIKGVDYFDGVNGKDGINGKDGTNGKDGADGKDGIDGKDYVITEADYDAIAEKVDITQYSYVITEDMVDVTTDTTKGVAPYSTSYGYTNIEIHKDANIKWVEGAVYSFVVNTKMVVASATRNVRVRIGGENDGDVWHPLMGYTTSIMGGSSYFIKAMTILVVYKTSMRPEGGLHQLYDANTTYAYLVNTIIGDATDSPIQIDDNGYGARYTLLFPTTPISNLNERWSSLVASSSTATTKKINAVSKFYLDRHPIYNYSANITKGVKAVNSVYQDYTGMDLRYSVNTSATYLTRTKKAFLWLKNFDENDLSFEADVTIGNIMTIDKIATRFPSTTSGDVYLYYLGTTTTNWYGLSPNFTQVNRLFKYTPSTGELTRTNILVG